LRSNETTNILVGGLLEGEGVWSEIGPLRRPQCCKKIRIIQALGGVW